MNISGLIKKIAYKIVFSPKAKVSVTFSTIDYHGILLGRRCVITGGSRGIGYAIAKKFVNEGANVLITGRNEKHLEKICGELGDSAKYILYDAESEDATVFFEKCNRVYEDGFDTLVLNAGISLHEGDFLKVTTEGFDQQFNVNLKANYFLSQKFIQQKLSEAACANILFLSSETGYKSNDLPYGLTKNAINSLVGGVSRRVYQKGIRVNAIAPGLTYTDMTRERNEEKDANIDYSNNSSAGRFLLPEEIAEVACFLVSDASKCITGEVLYCDAGSHLKVNGSEFKYSL